MTMERTIYTIRCKPEGRDDFYHLPKGESKCSFQYDKWNDILLIEIEDKELPVTICPLKERTEEALSKEGFVKSSGGEDE